ncbi:hypothetical protein BD626DRAFT_547799 [Schizophyllum amplum]|uniref:G-patch domain-containing protein n=1 Tax=Schizophyllum amplum TaxID=97359 RepID=A0A550CH05_9AGAR|nr:hypothetical protein BD626DRAFT_547799 [Auriculariopsis ampla]
MVLNTHGYLVSQGWSGQGNGLRHGAIARPIIIAQKKNNKGLGKERDDGFQFWNHVFDAAVKTINIKIADSDDESDDKSDDNAPTLAALNRTSTGILSNRAPVLGVSALSSETSSGTSTPTVSMSIFAQAKRETAKRTLYGRFYRGAVIKSDDDDMLQHEVELAECSSSSSPPLATAVASESAVTLSISAAESTSASDSTKKRKKEKKERTNHVLDVPDPKEDKRKRKVEKREKKEEKRRKEKGKGKETGPAAVVEEPDTRMSEGREKKESRKRKSHSNEDTTIPIPDIGDAPAPEERPKKKRKKDDQDPSNGGVDAEAARKERKRLKREAKAAASLLEEEKRRDEQ